MTNYERIKQMSIEEMARCKDMCPFEFKCKPALLYSIGICKIDEWCDECRKKWLESEVDE